MLRRHGRPGLAPFWGPPPSPADSYRTAGAGQQAEFGLVSFVHQRGYLGYHTKIPAGIVNAIPTTIDASAKSQSGQLAEILDKLILPRKGKLSAINKEIESADEFKEARRKHSAVESSINAIENHGLDRCRDHGLHGFKRYVGLAVLARNIQIIGHILQQKERIRLQRLEKKHGNKLSAVL